MRRRTHVVPRDDPFRDNPRPIRFGKGWRRVTKAGADDSQARILAVPSNDDDRSGPPEPGVHRRSRRLISRMYRSQANLDQTVTFIS